MTTIDKDVTDVILKEVAIYLEDTQTNAVDLLPKSQLITVNSGGRSRERLIGAIQQIVTSTVDEELFKKVEQGELTKEEYNTQRHSIEFRRVK